MQLTVDTQTPLRTSVSELIEHRRDPAKWAYKYIAKRRPRESEPALEIGIVIHRLFASALTDLKEGREIQDLDKWPAWARMQLLLDWQQRELPADDKALRQVEACATRAARFFEQARLPFRRVVEVEWRGETKLGDVILEGTLDALVEDWEGALVHQQLKTTSTKTPDVQLAVLKRSWHEVSYGSHAQKIAAREGLKYGGSKFVLLSKDSIADAKGVDKGRGHGIWIADTGMGQARVVKAYVDLIDQSRKMLADRVACQGWDPDQPPYYPPVAQNDEECGGMHGNSLCKYYDVCEGKFAITNNIIYTDYNPNERYGR